MDEETSSSFTALTRNASSRYFTRIILMRIGASQGSIMAATLFRLHVHFLPFFSLTSHMFADDLAIQISGDLEKRFSLNVMELE